MQRIIWIALLIAVAPSARAVELNDVLKFVPGQSNTVAVINVKEINKSARAQKEGWSKNHETEYMAGALAVPPWASFVVIGAQIYPGELAEGKSLVLVPISAGLYASDISAREGGTTQMMGENTVVLSPKRGYAAIPYPGILGVSSTFPRQEYSRWINQPKPEKMSISPYLQESIKANATAPIVIASDLTDIFDPQAVRMELLKGGISKEDPMLDLEVQAISNIRGMTIKVEIGNPSPVEIQIDFKSLNDSQAKAFQTMLPKVIEIAGLEITEIAKSTITKKDKSIILKTAFSDSSLRRLLSVVSSPADAAKSPEAGNIMTPKESAVLASSMRYYRSVNGYLDDLKSKGNSTKPNDYSGSATWYESYANKIDKLPIENVDPELLKYSASATSKLRALAGSLRGLKVQLDAYDSYKTVVTSNASSTYVTPRGKVGVAPSLSGGSMDSNYGELSAKQAELVAQTAPDRVKVWTVLDSDRSAVRRLMLDKYKIDFEKLKREQ